MEEAEPHIAAQWRGLAATHGKRPAIVDDAGTWSYQQIAERIFRFAKDALPKLAHQDLLQSATQDGMIIGDEYPNHLTAAGCF